MKPFKLCIHAPEARHARFIRPAQSVVLDMRRARFDSAAGTGW